MVDVAQLVELRIVVPAVVGSKPIVHPIIASTPFHMGTTAHGPLAQLVEQWTLNPLVEGSNPSWPTKSLSKPGSMCPGFLFLRRRFEPTTSKKLVRQPLSAAERRSLAKGEAQPSNPTWPTNITRVITGHIGNSFGANGLYPTGSTRFSSFLKKASFSLTRLSTSIPGSFANTVLG